MTGHGGARAGAGAPPGHSGGKREGAGRPKNVPEVTMSPARFLPPSQKWAYAEHALQYAHEMLDRMVDLARNAQSEQVRLLAQDKILDRAMGKAPQHIDTSAVRHTEIVCRSAEEIRQELLARGVPQVPLDYTPPAPEPSADSDKP
jgi:hypothetical protein